jgi:hypothetical protein
MDEETLKNGKSVILAEDIRRLRDILVSQQKDLPQVITKRFFGLTGLKSSGTEKGR